MSWVKGYVQLTFLLYNSWGILIRSSSSSSPTHLHQSLLSSLYNIATVATVVHFYFETPICSQSINTKPGSFFEVLATIERQPISHALTLIQQSIVFGLIDSLLVDPRRKTETRADKAIFVGLL
ncbi:hypothetical protein F4823DRAFT_482923 [Ustulina deusta]|nr:hypothetical protein F4823DRAFT_482923 [Ustulina deusta]